MIKTFHFGLVGFPIDHSLSPLIQSAALQAAGLKGDYMLFEIEQSSRAKHEISSLLDRCRMGELDGLNITLPFKQKVIPMLDGVTDRARRIGAANTIYREADHLIGDNTDAPGFLTDLTHQFRLNRGNALVLGAGGSARAVVYSLTRDGWMVYVAARNLDQAKTLATSLQLDEHHRIKSLPLTSVALSPLLETITLVVNATTAGMYTQIDQTAWPIGLPIRSGTYYYDLVYNPAITKFLQNAESAGCSISGGIGLLIEQGALAFELWTGFPASRLAMRNALPV